jgi:hypothetical protein
MLAWGLILLIATLVVSFGVQGWLLYRAGRWLDIDLEPVWATVVVFVASVVEGVVSLAIFLVLFGRVHLPLDRTPDGLQRWSEQIAPTLFWPEVLSSIGGFIAFVATIAVMLDLSVPRAALLSILFLIFQMALVVFTLILCGNLMILTALWSGS